MWRFRSYKFRAGGQAEGTRGRCRVQKPSNPVGFRVFSVLEFGFRFLGLDVESFH